MKGFWSNYGDLIIGVVLVALAMSVHNHILSLGITLVIGVYSFLRPKRALYFLLIYVPARPTIIAIDSSLKAIADVIIFLSFLRVLYDSRDNWKSIFQLKLFEWAFLIYCIFGSLVGHFITGVPLVAVVFESRALLLFFLLFYIVRRLD